LRLLVTILLLVVSSVVDAQQANNLIVKGNEAYRKQDYKTASANYSKALQKDSKNAAAKFNMGNAFQQQQSYEEATKFYDDLISTSKDASLKTKAFNNSGLAMVRQQQLEQAIDRFKGALRIDPSDNETRENLQKAINELKKKQNKDQNKDQKKQDKKEDEKNDKQKQPQQPKNNLSQNKADQLLKQLQEQEKQLQKQLQKQKTSVTQPEKDW
jgi:Ca-activated chloride channel family protein